MVCCIVLACACVPQTIGQNIQDMDRGHGDAGSGSDTESGTEKRGKVKALLSALDMTMVVVYKTGLVRAHTHTHTQHTYTHS